MKGKAQGIKLGRSHHCSDAQTNRQCFIAENQNEPLGRACHKLCWPVWGGGQSLQSCCSGARWMQEDASWMRHPVSACEEVFGCAWMLQELQLGVLPPPGALVTRLDRAPSGLPLLWLLEILWGDLWMGNFCSRFPCLGWVSVVLNSQLGGYASVLSALALPRNPTHLFLLRFLLLKRKIICSLPHIGLQRANHCSLAVVCFKRVKSMLWRGKKSNPLVRFWQVSNVGSLLSSAEQLGIAGTFGCPRDWEDQIVLTCEGLLY